MLGCPGRAEEEQDWDIISNGVHSKAHQTRSGSCIHLTAKLLDTNSFLQALASQRRIP